MKTAIDSAHIDITSYACQVCGKWHRKPSKKFFAHYEAANKKHKFKV